MSAPEIPVVTTEELIEGILKGAIAHNVITENFMKSFLFYEHTLEYWLADVSVEIPKEITPETFRMACTTLGRKMQKANYFFSIANTMHNALNSTNDIKKSDLVAALMEHYSKGEGRRPAAATLERMADSYMGGPISNKITARILKDFWRDRRDSLIEVRKTLEQIGYSIHAELKYLQDTDI